MKKSDSSDYYEANVLHYLEDMKKAVAGVVAAFIIGR